MIFSKRLVSSTRLSQQAGQLKSMRFRTPHHAARTRQLARRYLARPSLVQQRESDCDQAHIPALGGYRPAAIVALPHRVRGSQLRCPPLTSNNARAYFFHY
jgi:hypothetical protein